MKYKLSQVFSCAMSLFLLASCAGQSENAEPPVAKSTEMIVPADPNTYDDVNDIFLSAFPEGTVKTVKSQNWIETHITSPEFTSDDKPSGWDGITQLLCDATISACNAIAGSDYGTENICAQLLTENGDILATTYNGKLSFSAFKSPEEPGSSSSNKATITQHEFDMIGIGMRYSEVVEIIGGEGDLYTEIGSAGSFIGSYKNYVWYGEGMFPGRAILSFDDYVLYSKIAYGLS